MWPVFKIPTSKRLMVSKNVYDHHRHSGNFIDGETEFCGSPDLFVSSVSVLWLNR